MNETNDDKRERISGVKDTKSRVRMKEFLVLRAS